MVSRWLFLVCMLGPTTRSPADEPALRGKPLSEWLTMLGEDAKPERRQAALLAVEVLNDNSAKTVRAVAKAARKDAHVDVRRQAVQLLGGMGLNVARRPGRPGGGGEIGH